MPDNDIHEILKDVNPHTIKAHPVVRSTTQLEKCADTVNRLKAGPANIPSIINQGKSSSTYKYTDDTFKQTAALYNTNFIQDANFKSLMDTKFGDSSYRWEKTSAAFSNAGILNSANSV